MSRIATTPALDHIFRLSHVPTVDIKPTGASFCSVSRVCTPERRHGHTVPFTEYDGYLAGVHLRALRSYDLWLGRRFIPAVPFMPGGLCFHHLDSEPEADFHEPFDIVYFYAPRALFDEIAYAQEVPPVGRLSCPMLSKVDPVLHHLALSVVPALEQSHATSRLFLESILLAFASHVMSTYGEAPLRLPRPGPRLAPWQAHRAKEYIRAHLGGNCGLADIANECALSASHFARAFKATVGKSPHRWLLEQRIEAAKALMQTTDHPLADIALMCGFSDQGHFSRAFSGLTRCAPSAWRRAARASSATPQ